MGGEVTLHSYGMLNAARFNSVSPHNKRFNEKIEKQGHWRKLCNPVKIINFS